MCCTNPLAGAAFMAVRSVARPNERVYFLFESSGRPRGPPPHTDYVASILVINVLHASTVGMGFIPILLQRGLFSLAKPLRTQSQEMESFSDKNRKNPCRDARAMPYVSSLCRRASKQASASRHREETAFVPQACITARKTGKTADAEWSAAPL